MLHHASRHTTADIYYKNPIGYDDPISWTAGSSVLKRLGIDEGRWPKDRLVYPSPDRLTDLPASQSAVEHDIALRKVDTQGEIGDVKRSRPPFSDGRVIRYGSDDTGDVVQVDSVGHDTTMI